MDENVGVAVWEGRDSNAADSRAIVKFFHHPTIKVRDSQEAGRPVFEDIEMISIIWPGEKEAVQVMANPWHRRRFQRQYDAFKNGQEVAHSGSPLDLLFPAKPALVKTLNQFNIFTVENLAGVADGMLDSLPQGRELQRRAQAYIASATSGSRFHEMQAQIEALTAQLASMKEDGFAPKAVEPVKQQRAPSATKGWPKGKPRGPRNPPAQEAKHDDIGG